ncbi:SDR family oxidoreductase [Francisella sp. Scap27]|uniref:SDR family NAD(P)-dependent oxidoreductase n=1 Tax=Francisella sp. Scap27 TaxID=2589986 RepID=UPI0015BAFE8B|nr:SDR family oxidoreductase [Francisella sp. Scap27]QLE79734.1 SDR family oxidoreductase [Francisella sp. Scap27]
MKNYLVTGGSDGIGRAVVSKLISKGHKVINLDIKKPQKMLTNEIFIEINLSQYHDVDKYIPLGFKYDGVFLNVGVHTSGSVFTQSLSNIESSIAINLMSNVAVIKALEHNFAHGCSIVFNGSDQCLVGKPNSFAYGMTKGAIAQITKSLALDLADRNIRVNTICPSTTNTGLYKDAIARFAQREKISLAEAENIEANEFPLGRIAEPSEVANVVYFLLSGGSSYMTGTLIPIDGGYTVK